MYIADVAGYVGDTHGYLRQTAGPSDDTSMLSTKLPTVGFENPGATRDLRGVEPNTGPQSENSYDLPPQVGSIRGMDTAAQLGIENALGR